MTDQLTPGLRQAAITLLALGKDHAAKVLAKMDEHEAAALTRALLAVGAVAEDEIRASLVDLASGMGKLSDVSAPKPAWVTEVLTEAVGRDKARHLVAEATRPEPFAWMLGADPDVLVTVLDAESPATCAIVLSNIDPGLGGKLLRKLSPARRDATAARMAELDAVAERTLREVDAALREQVGEVVSAPTRPVDGVARLADLLGRVPRRESDQVLVGLREWDAKRASKVKEQMFTFTDVLGLERRDLQKVLAAVETRSLAVALHGATADEVEIVFANLPERAAANLREEVDFLGPVRASEVRVARREIVSLTGSLEAEGTISRATADVDDEDDDDTGSTETTERADAGDGDADSTVDASSGEGGEDR